MKIPAQHHQKGFTLAEMTVSVALFSLVVIGCLSVQLTCLKLARFESTRSASASQALEGTSRLLIEMRGAYSNRVGSITGSDPTTFVPVAINSNQVGDALLILLTNTPTPWICYYYVSASNRIYRAESGNPTAATLMASSVTNYDSIFKEENAAGGVLSNAVAVSITSVNLRFVTTNTSTMAYFSNPTNYLSFQIRAYPRFF